VLVLVLVLAVMSPEFCVRGNGTGLASYKDRKQGSCTPEVLKKFDIFQGLFIQ